MGLFKTKDSSNKNKQNKTSNKKKSKDKTISELEQNFGYPTSPSRNSEFINNRQQGFYNQNPNLNQASNQFVIIINLGSNILKQTTKITQIIIQDYKLIILILI